MAEFREVINNMNRMCGSFENCSKCPVNKFNRRNCGFILKRFPKEAEEIIMQWAKENPSKTNRDKFKEVFGIEIADDDYCLFAGSDICKENSKCNKCECYNFWDKEYIERSEDSKLQ